MTASQIVMSQRFRGFMPVVVDVETGGFNYETDALLELAAVLLDFSPQGLLAPTTTYHFHISPFPGANLEQTALDFLGMDPYHPFRDAILEQEALTKLFGDINRYLAKFQCNRAVLVGHNPSFDLSFIKAASARCKIKRTPFHPFTTFDTATLAGLAYGQTVLAKALQAANLDYDSQQAHSALYDAEQTAKLFCKIVNRWHYHESTPG